MVLRDGRALLMRPALPGDADLIINGRNVFSDETVYRRFMSRGLPGPALLRSLFEVDFADHFAWVLVDPVSGALVAEARYIRDRDDPAAAEIALSVADAFQGSGAGSLLLDAVSIAAKSAGIQRFNARLLVSNIPMRCILNRFAVVWSHDEPGIVCASFPVPDDAGLTAWEGLARCIRRTAMQIAAV